MSVVGAHRTFAERMNFISLWSRNETGIFEQSKMPAECIAAQSPISPSLGKLRLLSLGSRKTPKGGSLSQPHWPESTGLPGANLSWLSIPSQRIELLGNSPPRSQHDLRIEIPNSPVRILSRVEAQGPAWPVWPRMGSLGPGAGSHGDPSIGACISFSNVLLHPDHATSPHTPS